MVQSVCPILSRLARRYASLWGFGACTIGTWSVTDSPWPARPEIFFGLLVRMRMLVSPRSTRICAPIP